MGMGLSIARTIIETHGGRIWAENRSSGGAVLRFTLPLVETDTHRASGQPGAVSATAARCR
jgi:signal transduction histidine kinase